MHQLKKKSYLQQKLNSFTTWSELDNDACFVNFKFNVKSIWNLNQTLSHNNGRSFNNQITIMLKVHVLYTLKYWVLYTLKYWEEEVEVS